VNAVLYIRSVNIYVATVNQFSVYWK